MHLTGELVSETVEPKTVFDEEYEELEQTQQEAQEAHAGVGA